MRSIPSMVQQWHFRRYCFVPSPFWPTSGGFLPSRFAGKTNNNTTNLMASRLTIRSSGRWVSVSVCGPWTPNITNIWAIFNIAIFVTTDFQRLVALKACQQHQHHHIQSNHGIGLSLWPCARQWVWVLPWLPQHWPIESHCTIWLLQQTSNGVFPSRLTNNLNNTTLNPTTVLDSSCALSRANKFKFSPNQFININQLQANATSNLQHPPSSTTTSINWVHSLLSSSTSACIKYLVIGKAQYLHCVY